MELVTFQFQGDARIWWKAYMECMTVRLLHLLGLSFTQIFLKKYVPRTFRDKKRDEFTNLEQ